MPASCHRHKWRGAYLVYECLKSLLGMAVWVAGKTRMLFSILCGSWSTLDEITEWPHGNSAMAQKLTAK